eukprot:6848607-Ditylum_brightwellii.AAC.1
MDEYTAKLEKWEQEITDNVETLVLLHKLIAFMQQGQCLIAIDGSASDNCRYNHILATPAPVRQWQQ